MQLTNRDGLNFNRFGCTFRAEEHRLCIRWEEQRRHQAVSAYIVARIIHSNHPSGPLLTLALEISPTKALAHYCFFPFDLKDAVHRAYIANICKERKIELSFLIDSGRIDRVYEVLPGQCKRMSELYTTAIAAVETMSPNQFDFDSAVTEFEQSVRLVDHFDYAISKVDLRSMITSAATKAEAAAPEHRIQARKIANDFLEIFRSRRRGWVGEQFPNIPRYLRTARFLSDLHDEFDGDPDRLTQFVADSITANAPPEDLNTLPAVLLFLEAVSRLIDSLQKTVTTENGQRSQEQARAVQDVLGRTLGGQGMSISAFQSLISIFGFELGGKPGRPGKDSLAEYELRASGKKWREVAEYILETDQKLSDEFGGRKFSQLSQIEKLNLTHRVKERLRAYAERTGKPFPPQNRSRLLLCSEEDQQQNPDESLPGK